MGWENGQRVWQLGSSYALQTELQNMRKHRIGGAFEGFERFRGINWILISSFMTNNGQKASLHIWAPNGRPKVTFSPDSCDRFILAGGHVATSSGGKKNHTRQNAWCLRLPSFHIYSNVNKTIINHPPNHHFYVAWLPFPVMASLWHCFSHIIFHLCLIYPDLPSGMENHYVCR